MMDQQSAERMESSSSHDDDHGGVDEEVSQRSSKKRSKRGKAKAKGDESLDGSGTKERRKRRPKGESSKRKGSNTGDSASVTSPPSNYASTTSVASSDFDASFASASGTAAANFSESHHDLASVQEGEEEGSRRSERPDEKRRKGKSKNKERRSRRTNGESGRGTDGVSTVASTVDSGMSAVTEADNGELLPGLRSAPRDEMEDEAQYESRQSAATDAAIVTTTEKKRKKKKKKNRSEGGGGEKSNNLSGEQQQQHVDEESLPSQKSGAARREDKPQLDYNSRVREKVRQTNEAISASYVESRGSTSTVSHVASDENVDSKRGHHKEDNSLPSQKSASRQANKPRPDHNSRIQEKMRQTNDAIASSYLHSRGSTSSASYAASNENVGENSNSKRVQRKDDNSLARQKSASRQANKPRPDHNSRIQEKMRQTNDAIASSYLHSRGSTSTASYAGSSRRVVEPGAVRHGAIAVSAPPRSSSSSNSDSDYDSDGNDANLSINEDDYMDAKAEEREIRNHLAQNAGAIGAYHIEEAAPARQNRGNNPGRRRNRRSDSQRRARLSFIAGEMNSAGAAVDEVDITKGSGGGAGNDVEMGDGEVPNVDDGMDGEDPMRDGRREGLTTRRSENMMNASARFLGVDSDDEARSKLKRRICLLSILSLAIFVVVGGVTAGIRALMIEPPEDEPEVFTVSIDETSNEKLLNQTSSESGDVLEMDDTPKQFNTKPLTEAEIAMGMVDGRPLTETEKANGEVVIGEVVNSQLFP